MTIRKPWQLPSQPATRSILSAHGVSPEMIRSALRCRRIVRVRQGVFLASDAWPTDPVDQHVVRARAELAVSPEAVISRHSAAIVWGLPSPTTPWHELLPTVSLPAGKGFRTRVGHSARHVEQLPDHHVTRDAEGYAVTRIERTAVDLAAGRPLPEMLVLLDAAARALCASFVSSPRRSDFANQHLGDTARTRLADVARERRHSTVAAACVHADPRRESPAESLSAGHFILADLPAPVVQHRIRLHGAAFYPDFLWAEQHLIGECDGAGKYADLPTETILREKEREQLLRDAGYTVVRWLATEIMQRPAVVVERVARALGAYRRTSHHCP